jgi:uncharacterized membrane protein YdjX (TVP38/TMEM64 family)
MQFIDELFQYLANLVSIHPWLAPLLAFSLTFLEAIIPSLPLTLLIAFNVSILSSVSGTASGTLQAIFFSTAGSFVGMILIFFLIRKVLRPYFEKKVAGHTYGEKFMNVIHGKNTWIVLSLLSNPLLPSSIMNYALSLTKVKVSKYLILTLISRFIVVGLLILLGSFFNIQNEPINIVWMLLFYSFILIVFNIRWKKRHPSQG